VIVRAAACFTCRVLSAESAAFLYTLIATSMPDLRQIARYTFEAAPLPISLTSMKFLIVLVERAGVNITRRQWVRRAGQRRPSQATSGHKPRPVASNMRVCAGLPLTNDGAAGEQLGMLTLL
jgi:hypothetical protein